MYLNNLLTSESDYIRKRAEWGNVRSIANRHNKYRKNHLPRGKAFRKLELRELQVMMLISSRA